MARIRDVKTLQTFAVVTRSRELTVGVPAEVRSIEYFSTLKGSAWFSSVPTKIRGALISFAGASSDVYSLIKGLPPQRHDLIAWDSTGPVVR